MVAILFNKILQCFQYGTFVPKGKMFVTVFKINYDMTTLEENRKFPERHFVDSLSASKVRRASLKISSPEII